MANIFKKLGLIEDVELEVVTPVVEEEVEPEISVDVMGVNADNVVADIYEINDFNLTKESIFTAESFMKTLPAEMPKEIKRASVVGIIAAAGMDINRVINDGVNRLETLDAALKSMTMDNDAAIAIAQANIEALNSHIEDEKTVIFNINAEQEHIEKEINAECKRIIELLDFLKEEK